VKGFVSGVGLALLCLVAGTARFVWGDVIELKTGQRVEGNFKQATPNGVVIEVGGQDIRFKTDQVRAIYFGRAPGVPPGQPSSLQEAIRSLKALQSVTSGSVTYSEYASRVNDAKIVVDRYLEEAERDDGILRDAVKAAIGYYVLVSSLWNAKIASRGGYETASENPLVKQCAPTQKVITTVRHFRPLGGDYTPYSELGPGDRGIWLWHTGCLVFCLVPPRRSQKQSS